MAHERINVNVCSDLSIVCILSVTVCVHELGSHATSSRPTLAVFAVLNVKKIINMSATAIRKYYNLIRCNIAKIEAAGRKVEKVAR